MVFDKEWFEKHQKKLLFFLNFPLTRKWFRKKLFIWDKRPIVLIGPSNYSVATGKENEYEGDFRCSPKYAKRLYKVFYPIWWVCHQWDEFINSLQIPELTTALDTGFSTLTVYPDTTSGKTTVDGTVLANRAGTWAQVHDSADEYCVGFTDYASGVTMVDLYTTSVSGQFAYITRAIFTLDTRPLTSNANITGATFRVYGASKADPLGNDLVCLCFSNPTYDNNIIGADYNRFPDTDSPSNVTWSTTGYNAFSMSGYLDRIDSVGITKLALRGGWDLNNNFTGTWVASSESYRNGMFADDTDGTRDPYLSVTYTIIEPVKSTQIWII